MSAPVALGSGATLWQPMRSPGSRRLEAGEPPAAPDGRRIWLCGGKGGGLPIPRGDRVGAGEEAVLVSNRRALPALLKSGCEIS